MWNSLFNQGVKIKFFQVYDDATDFEENYLASPFVSSLYKQVSHEMIVLTYNLLLSRYYNYDITNNRDWFVLNVARIMAEYAPQFERELSEQKALLELTDKEIETGTRQIYNRASNPEMTPSTSTLSELPFINEQTSTNVKKSKLDARIDYLDTIAHINYTEIYLDRFKGLFSKFLSTISPVLYESEEDE